jgi:hypothetical protein
MFFKTNDPAPITTPLSIVMPLRTMQLTPIQTPSAIDIYSVTGI